MNMASLIMTGAGASAFSGQCAPACPPLGASLFDELTARGGVIGSVAPDLAEVFRQDFELGMFLFRQQRGAEVTRFLIEMALYFAGFEPGPQNLYVQLLAALSETKRKVVMATLNYDLLIELAASLIGRTISYRLSSSNKADISVLKPHGSCNFLPDLEPRQVFNLGLVVADPSRRVAVLDAGIRPARVPEVIEFCSRENAVAPALALYEKGKQTLFCPSFVKMQQDDLNAAALQASRIFVIGVRVNEDDEHIWGPLARTRVPLYYVDPDASEFFSWARRNNRRAVTHLAPTFAAAVPEIVALHARR